MQKLLELRKANHIFERLNGLLKFDDVLTQLRLDKLLHLVRSVLTINWLLSVVGR